ncbi:hypothetical protein ACCQ23_16180 [Xanthomonas axonopodis pv. phyllanthi]|uniref:hypothetical protein n=1 Tax=Xanthomonas axonopodis TaxID=53413 RepID=UPI0035568FF8
MADINIPRNVQDVLRRIDSELLRTLIDQCLRDEQPSALRELPLHDCGPFVSTKRHDFERALRAYGKAKAEKKRAETLYNAQRAGDALLNALQQMQHRMATEVEEGERFFIDDLITPPYSLGAHLSVRVSYRWRPSSVDPWTHSDITFLYDVDLRPDYTRPLAVRKRSVARQEREHRERLYQEWEHLKDQALYSVRDYFKDGGNGADIPKTFRVKPDAYTRGLNNFSARFWLPRDLVGSTPV